MTGEADNRASAPRNRREFAALLLAGAVGAVLVLLATRLQIARVEVHAPRPLPVTTSSVNGQALLPAQAALAVAALAAMAAVLATRGLLRRITGLVVIALGVGMAVSAAAGISAAEVLTAAGHANLSPSSGAGGGAAPGSTTAGSDAGHAIGSLAGFPAHVVFAGSAWRLLMLAGAVLIILVGGAVFAIGGRLPAMSARYERSSQRSGTASPGRTAAASLWESLSAGADPTSIADEDEADGVVPSSPRYDRGRRHPTPRGQQTT
jgi:uncharacterized membrane protein (TIGR02234 family)